MLGGVHPIQLALLSAAAVLFAQAQDASHSLANERTSIERTYELTKYLEHQLKEIKDTYLSYLGPPFSDKDFSPPRPNSTALSLPSAATRLELWRGLENRARLAQNQRAYAVLLGAVRELARSTLCPYLQTSLLHFSTGLDGLLGSISGLMSSLGYALPPSADAPGGGGGDKPQYPWRNAGGDGGRASSRPAPLMTQSLYKARARSGSGGRDNSRRNVEARVLWGEQEEDGTRKSERRRERMRDGRRVGEAPAATGRSSGSRQEERGRRGKRESDIWAAAMPTEKDDIKKEEGREQGRGRRRLLSISEDGGEMEGQGATGTEPGVSISFPGATSGDPHGHPGPFNSNNNNNNLYSYKLNHPQHRDTGRMDDEKDEGHTASILSSSSSSQGPHLRAPRSLFPPTLHPPLPPLSFFPFGGEEEHPLLIRPVPLSLRRPAAVLSPPPLPPFYSSPSSSSSASAPLLSVRPALSDFSRKVEGFWVLRELQSWLWRSAKDFNRLKKRLRA